jgi:hypothetical protein
MALGEERHPGKTYSGKRGTREQKMMWENGDIFKTLLPECLSLALGEEFFCFLFFLPHFFLKSSHII